jgi:hypothetical protein
VVASTIASLGLLETADGAEIPAFDEQTAAILAENLTPEIEQPAGEWTDPEGDEEEEAEGPEA